MSSFQPLGTVELDPFQIASLTGPDARTGIYLDADQENSSVLIETNNTPAVYVDKFQNFGINTTAPSAQLDVNSASNSHIQLTYNGSDVNKARIGVTSDGKLVLTAGGSEVNVDTLSNFNVKSHNGTSAGLMLGNSMVYATADQLNFNVVTPGTASVSKSVVLDSSGSVSGINSLSATTLTGTLQTEYQPNVRTVETLDVASHNGTIGLKLGGVAVTATAEEVNYVDTTPGLAAASKAMILDSSRDISNIHNLLADNLTGTLQTAVQPNITSLGTLTGLSFNGPLTGLTELSINTTEGGRTLVVNSETGNCARLYYDAATNVSNYADLLVDNIGNLSLTASGGNVDITSHDGLSMGLKLGGILVTASADEINFISDTVPGNVTAGKAVVVDANRNVGNLAQVTMTQMYGTVLTPAQPYISSVSELNITAHDGTAGLKLAGELVTAVATELNYVDTTQGSIQASKAAIVDSNKDIAGFNTVTANYFVGTLNTTAQPNVTSVGTLTSISTSGDLTMGSTVISETEIGYLDGITPGIASATKALVVDGTASIGGIDTLSATSIYGQIQDSSQPLITSVETLDINSHDGATAGLSLAGTMVTASASEINYVDVAPGAGTASKALVLDAMKNISGINSLTATDLTGTLQTAAQPNVTSVGTLTSLAVAGDITIGSTTLSDPEVAVLDAVTPGVVSASKALVVDADKNIATINSLTATTIIGTDITGTIQTASQPLITSVSTLDVTAHDGATQGLKLGGVLLTATAAQINSIFGAGGTGTFNDLAVNHNLTIPNADGATQGIILGETLLTSSADELNYLDGSLPGTVVASKAVVVDENKDISSFRNLTAVNLTGTLQTAAQPNVTSVGTLISLAVAGDVTVGSTVISESEIAQIDGVTAGTASASKAVVLDSSKNISGLNTVSAGALTLTPSSFTYFSNGLLPGANVAPSQTFTTGLVASSPTLGISLLGWHSSTSYIMVMQSASEYGFKQAMDVDAIPYYTRGVAWHPGIAKFIVVRASGTTSGQLYYQTSANGLTWTNKASTGQNGSPGTGLIYHPTSNTVCMMYDNKLLFSSDGTTWSTITLTAALTTSSPVVTPGLQVCGKYLLCNRTAASGTTSVASWNGTSWVEEGRLSTTLNGLPLRAYMQNEDRLYLLPSAPVNSTTTGTLTVSYIDNISTVPFATWSTSAPTTVTFTNVMPLISTAIYADNDYGVVVRGILSSGYDSSNTTSFRFLRLVNLNKVTDITDGGSGSTNQYAGISSSTLFRHVDSLVIASPIATGNYASVLYSSPVGANCQILFGTTTITEPEVAVLDDVTAGTASATKALVVDASKNITGINTLTSSTLATTTLTIGSASIDATELGYLDTTTPGTVSASHAVVVDANKDISSFRNLTSTNLISSAGSLTMGTTNISESEIVVLDSVTPGTVLASHAVVVDANKDVSSFNNLTSVNLISSAGSLTMGATTLNEDEVKVLDNVVPGVVAPAHAVVVDGNKDISSFRNLTSVTLTSTSGSLTMGGTNINETEIAYLDDATPGAALPLKAVVLDTDSSFVGINELSATTLESTAGDLTMGATNITESEIGVLDAVVPGTASPSKALVIDSSKDISGIHALSANSLTSTDGSLTMGSTNISEFEISALDAVVPGIVSASRAVVVDENKDITMFRNLYAENLYGTLQTAAQPTVTSLGTLTSLTVEGDITTTSGDITIGSTTFTETIAGELVDATLGLATASHALVTDENNRIVGLDTLGSTNISATNIAGTLTTGAQPNITSVTTLDITGADGSTAGLKLGGVLLTATADQINSIFGAGGTGTFEDLDVTHNLTLPNADGSTQGIVLGDTLVTSTGTELNYVDTTPGHAQAVKALVVDSARSIDNIHDLTADNLYGTIRTGAQPDITSVTTLDITAHDGLTQGLRLGGELLTATAAQINSIFGAGGEGTFNNLRVNDTLTIANADGAEMGIVLGETLLTASGIELNYLDGSTPGTATASNALVLDANRSITNINSLTATNLTGTLQTAAQPNVTSVGTLISLAVAGDVTVGSTTLNEAEIAVLDTVVPGVVAASRAVVVDANKDIASFRNLTAENLTGTLQTAAQPNVTSVGELISLDVAGDVNVGGNLNVGGTFISESEIVALDAAIPGTATATKAMVTDSDNSIAGINSLSADTLTGTLQTAAQPNITSVGTLTSLAVSGNMNCGGTLTVGGTIISESEIVALDAAVPGTAEPLKALITDNTNSIGGIATLSADALVGELQTSNQPNLTSVNTLDITLHDGAEMGLALDGVLVTATASELNYTDTTPGHAQASKALIFDENIDIDSIHNMSLVGLTSQTGSFTSTTDSSSASTGALVTAGGVGIAKNLSVGGNISLTGTQSITNTTDSTSASTGSLVTTGGVGIAKNLTVGADASIIGNLNVTGLMTQTGSATITNSTDSTASTNGALIVTGGAGIGKNLNVGANAVIGGTFAVTGASTLTGAVSILNTTDSTSISTGSIKTAGGVGITKNLNVGGNTALTGTLAITGNTTLSGTESISNTTDSTSTTTGSFITAGGAGIAKNLNVGVNTAIGGTLAVTGASTLTGNTSVGGTLAVTGASTFTGAMTANAGVNALNVSLQGGGAIFTPSVLTARTKLTALTNSVVPLVYDTTRSIAVFASGSNSASAISYTSNFSTSTVIPNSSAVQSAINGYSPVNVWTDIVDIAPDGTIFAGIQVDRGSGENRTAALLLGSNTSMTSVSFFASSVSSGNKVKSIASKSSTEVVVIVIEDSVRSLKYSTNGTTFTTAFDSTTVAAPMKVRWIPAWNKYVCGTGNSILYSTNGSTWSPTGLTTSAAVTSIYYNTFAGTAIATAGTDIYYSSNGTTWAKATYPSTAGITFGACLNSSCSALFVLYFHAYSSTKSVLYSTDGINWTAITGLDNSNTLGNGYAIDVYGDTICVDPVSGYAYANTFDYAGSGYGLMRMGSFKFATSLFGMNVLSNYLQNETGTGYKWYSGSTSSALGTQIMQLDSSLALTVPEAISNTTDSTSITTGSFTTAGGAGIAKNLNVGGTLTVSGGLSQNGKLNITDTTESTSTSTGAIVTAGGVGIAKSINVGINAAVGGTLGVTGDATFAGIEYITNSTESTSTTTGSFHTDGGAGIVKNLNVGGNTSIAGTLSATGDTTLAGLQAITNETDSTSPTTGSFVTAGGAGIALNLNVGVDTTIGGNLTVDGDSSFGGSITFMDDTQSVDFTTGALTTAGGVGITKNLNVGGTAFIENATPSTSATTGALVVAGGAGISSDLNIGGDLGIAGDINLIGDFNISGRMHASNVSLIPDAASPFSTAPLTEVTTQTSILSLNYHAGIAHIHTANALVVVPAMITNSSLLYYASNGGTTWSALALTGGALTMMESDFATSTIVINQISVNAWSTVIWAVGAIRSTADNTSQAIVLSGNLDDGMNQIYFVGSGSSSSANIAATRIAVATDDMNVAVVHSSGALYYMNTNIASTFSSVATGSFVSVAWLNGLGKFVATRTNTSAIYYSTSVAGTTWVDATTPTGVAPNTVFYNDTLNLAVAVGPNYLWYSTNAATWTKCNYTEIAAGNTFNAVVNSPVSGLLAVYSNAGNTMKQMWYSTDAIKWTMIVIPESFGYTVPLTSTVAFDQANYAYTVAYNGLSSIVQQIGPINSASMIYGVGITSGYMKNSTSLGYQWFNSSTPTDMGVELMELTSTYLQIQPIITADNTTNSTSSDTGALVLAGGAGIAKNLYVGQNVNIGGTLTIEGEFNQSGVFAGTDTTESTSTITGAIITAGGVGVAKSINVGIDATIGGNTIIDGTSTMNDDVSITSTTQSTSTSTGALIVAGGVGIAKNVNVGGNAVITGSMDITDATTQRGVFTSVNTTETISTSTGAVVVNGGVGIAKSIKIGQNATVEGDLTVISSTTLTGNVSIVSGVDATTSVNGGAFTVGGGAGIGKSLFVGDNVAVGENLSVSGTSTLTGDVAILNTTQSTSTSTGSFITAGGVGVAKDVFIGGATTIDGDLESNALARFTDATDASSTSTGALTVAGGVGIAKKLYVGSGIYGTLFTSYQPNLTSVDTLDITGANETNAGLKLAGSLVTANATELNYLDGSFPGSATAGNALVLDGAKAITGINALTADAITGTLQTGAQPNITSVTTLDITGADGSTAGLKLNGELVRATADQLNALIDGTSDTTFSNATVTGNLTLSNADGSTTGLILGSTLVTSTATELNYVDTTPGTAEASKALVLDVNRDITNINSLTATSLTGTLQTSYQPNLTSVDTLDVTGANGSTAGLALAGVLVTSTATELNYVDTTPGYAQASKALVLDASGNIQSINSLTATSLTGTLQTAAQPNITSVGTLTSLSLGGNLTMGSTVISESDIAKIDNVTNGTASADKALVLDANKDISGIHKLSSDVIAIGGPTNSNLPLEVGSLLYQTAQSYSYHNSSNANGLVNAGEGLQVLYSARFDSRVLVGAEIQITSDVRLKENIIELTPEFSRSFIETTTPVKFNWKSGDQITDYGYIAQSIAKAGFHDLVSTVPHPGLKGFTDEDGFTSPDDVKLVFSPGKIIPLLALNQKQVFAELDAKDQKIQDLEARIQKLEEALAKLL